MKHASLLALLFLAACSSKKSPPAATAASDGGAGDGGAGAPPSAIDTALEAELDALGEKRGAELEALVAEVTDDSSDDPDDPDGGDIPAIGPCTRPDAAKRAELAKQIDAWIAKAVPKATRPPESAASRRFGCIEPSGIVVDAQADLTFGEEERAGYTWVLRVAPSKITVYVDAKGCAVDECMEWAQQRTVGTVVLADLDGDGALDPIVARDDHEVGAMTSYDAILTTTRPPAVLGNIIGEVSAVPLATPVPGTVVLELNSDDGDEQVQYRCVTKTPPWTSCPIAERLARRERALEAAEDLGSLITDRDRLQDALELLEVPEADRTRFLAAAWPSPLSTVVERFLFKHYYARGARTPDEQHALLAARAAVRADEVRAAVGQPRCAAVAPAQAKAAAAQMKKWLAGKERGSGGVAVRSGCVGPAGALWLVEWTVPADEGKDQRVGLFHVAGAAVTKLVDGTTALVDEGPGGPAPDDESQLPTAKMFVSGASVGALVFGPGDKLTAVIDAAVTGSRDSDALATWEAYDEAGLLTIDGDTLARSEDGKGHVTYWKADPKGVVAAADLTGVSVAAAKDKSLLETIERQKLADVYLQELTDPSARAEIIEALTLLGAPADVLAQAGKAPAR